MRHLVRLRGREGDISANSQNRHFLATPLPKTTDFEPSSATYCQSQNKKRKSVSGEKKALLRFIAASLPWPQQGSLWGKSS